MASDSRERHGRQRGVADRREGGERHVVRGRRR